MSEDVNMLGVSPCFGDSGLGTVRALSLMICDSTPFHFRARAKSARSKDHYGSSIVDGGGGSTVGRIGRGGEGLLSFADSSFIVIVALPLHCRDLPIPHRAVWPRRVSKAMRMCAYRDALSYNGDIRSPAWQNDLLRIFSCLDSIDQPISTGYYTFTRYNIPSIMPVRLSSLSQLPRSLATRSGVRALRSQPRHSLASISDVPPVVSGLRCHKVVIVGGGSAGVTISNQLLRSGRFTHEDIALVDPAQWHHYQPGWTLVGGGLKNKDDLKKKLAHMVDAKVRFYNDKVRNFEPDQHSLSLGNGAQISYEHLVVCPGIKVDFNSIRGLQDAVSDPHAPVSSIYSYETCDKTARNLADFTKGKALFTHPSGTVKCAGAPQKIMWLALDGWKRAGLYNPVQPATSPIQMTFATAMPVMFGVPAYSQKLNQLREERNVEGLFQHDLVAIEGNTAVLAQADGKGEVRRHFDLLHAVPKMGPHAFVKDSALANEAGFVDVNDATLRHNRYPNVWSCGDAAGLPTSKTAAAITAQAPVVVSNLLSAMQGQAPMELYNGYTSCPLLTEYGKVMLAEFAYGGERHETFGRIIDQSEPSRVFYHMKKDFFPWVYYASMVKGTWAGPKGFRR